MAKISFVCNHCLTDTTVDKWSFTHRNFGAGEKLCKRCLYQKYRFVKLDPSKYPAELHDLLSFTVWPLCRVINHVDKLSEYAKIKISFDCEICKLPEVMELGRMKRRKICGVRPICRKCALKFSTNSEEWKESNSKAQYISQNRPEVKDRQRKSQLRLMELDDMYVEKRRNNSFLSGSIDGIYFDSSWELVYLVHCFESPEIKAIKRYSGSIPYRDSAGRVRRYFPDFEVALNEGDNLIVEIKGTRNKNSEAKAKCAREAIGKTYKLLNETELKAIGLFVRSAPYMRKFYNRIFKQYSIKLDNNKVTNKIKDLYENGEN